MNRTQLIRAIISVIEEAEIPQQDIWLNVVKRKYPKIFSEVVATFRNRKEMKVLSRTIFSQMSIYVLGLDRKTESALMAGFCFLVRDILEKTDEQLLQMYRINEARLEKIDDRIRIFGYERDSFASKE